MSVYYRINSGPDGSVLTVMGDVNATIDSGTPGYYEAVEYLTLTPPNEIDSDILNSYLSPKDAVTRYIKRVSDRVSFSGDVLLFDGDPIDTSLSHLIINLTKDDSGGDPTKLVRFLENLMTNPSEHSREQLYDWLSRRNFTITNDGHFLAYKGLRDDFTSINSGPGIVNSVEYKGSTHLDNSIGNIVEIARSVVNPDSYVGCSTGLHAGTYEYANSFAQGKLVLVKINPRDVVSVPTDCDAQKLRVCRYEVLEEVSGYIESSVYESDEDDEYYDDEYYDDDDLLDDPSLDDDYEDDYEEEEEEEDDRPDVDALPNSNIFTSIRARFRTI